MHGPRPSAPLFAVFLVVEVVVVVALPRFGPGALAGVAKPAVPRATDIPTSPRASATVPSVEDLREQVRKTEIAFARTMAERDHAAFASFLDEEAIFVGARRTLRGRQAIAEGWKALYEGAKAPFSWAPEKVEVVDSGTLALSSGPVHDPAGARIGTFHSTWRREGDGNWRILLDIGCPDCDCGERTDGDKTAPKKK